jgi:hypothetical protein
MAIFRSIYVPILSMAFFLPFGLTFAHAAQGDNRDILKQGLVGAATGALSSELSGGKPGQGALIGAGVNVIGGALLNLLTGPSATPYASQPAYYSQPTPPAQYYQPQIQYVYVPSPPVVRTVYVREPAYTQPAPAYPAYYYPPQEDPNRRILKQGLVGAATGALSAELSGGKAGKGALIGAGTNVIGGALLELLTS